MLGTQKKNVLDISLLICALSLWAIGVFLIFSATHIYESGPLVHSTRNQIIWIIMGVIVILTIISIPMRFFYSFAYLFYGASLLLLLYADITGVIAKGAERWVSIAGIKLQPSEFAKIGLILAFARYFSSKSISLENIKSLFIPLILLLIPFALILKQPDLGTALILGLMTIPILYWAGLSAIELFYLLSPIISLVLSAFPLIMAFTVKTSGGIIEAIPWGIFFIITCGILYFLRPRFIILVSIVIINLFMAGITNIVWNGFLQDYQKKRIFSFINPKMDPAGSGYQVIQSKVAIGSGLITGKGYLKGTQTRLSFLPEQHTDFIFSVLGEQFGFLGCIAIFLLYLFLIVRGYTTTQMVKNRFTNILIVGSISLIVFHVFINVAMTTGMMPVVGVPLPFLSYGGSFTMTLSVLLGFILNARYQKQDF